MSPQTRDNVNKRWTIIEDIIQTVGIARQHIDSFDEFITNDLQNIINGIGSIDIQTVHKKYTIKFIKIHIGKPRILESNGTVTNTSPFEARLRNITYASPVTLEISLHSQDRINTGKLYIGDLPVMVKSKICVLNGSSNKELIDMYGEDPKDPGGYFIINGSERVIIGTEDVSSNKAIVIPNTDPKNHEKSRVRIYSITTGYRSKIDLVYNDTKLVDVQIPGSPVSIPIIVLLKALGLETDKNIASAISLEPEIQDELDPIFEHARMVTTTSDAIQYIAKRVAPGMPLDFQEKRVDAILDWGVLPHIGREPEKRIDKAFLLADALCKLIENKLGWIEPDDRDSFSNKIVKFAGESLAELYRTIFRNFVLDLKFRLERMPTDIHIETIVSASRSHMITDRLNNALATGSWGKGRMGVTQLVDRLSYLGTVSHLRRIQSTLSRDAPNFEAREIGGTSFGRICPSETPEGSNTGLVKNLALSAIISVNSPVKTITNMLFVNRVINPKDVNLPQNEHLKEIGVKVFLNGNLVGYNADGQTLVEYLRQQRRSGKIHAHVGISLVKPKTDKGCTRVYINSNAGRILRPVSILENGIPLLKQDHIESIQKKEKTWSDLIPLGIIELIDAEEENNYNILMDEDQYGMVKNCARVLKIISDAGTNRINKEMCAELSGYEANSPDFISLFSHLQGAGLIQQQDNMFITDYKDDDIESYTKSYTHMEIFPPTVIGVAVSTIPYPDHNQSPRNTYGSSMAKQSVGFSTPLIYGDNTYTRQHMMLYPQRPIVTTKVRETIGLDDRPAGMNCVVAVLPFDGYNIEDGIVMSKASVERGLGRSFFFRTYDVESRKYPGNTSDVFEVPKNDGSVNGIKTDKAYEKLNRDDGIVAVNTSVEGDDIIIGRTSPPRFLSEYIDYAIASRKNDTSVSVRTAEDGVIASVNVTQNREGNKVIKLRTRQMRPPEIGDKFASRHGQKGVVGLLVNQEDLPYTENGMVPDIMINPHAFPSRMTVGMFLESITGKAAAIRGKPVDGTAFTGEKLDDVKDLLEATGFKYSGKETMYDGRTGIPFKVDVFIGIAYYQRLQHMVTDKIHTRARGHKQLLTRQPTDGRARGGGLRFGEMERDCIIAYGASMILKDRLLDESDKTKIEVCERCGLVAYFDIKIKKPVCSGCKELGMITNVEIAYSYKLLTHEIMGLGITPRFIVKPRF